MNGSEKCNILSDFYSLGHKDVNRKIGNLSITENFTYKIKFLIFLIFKVQSGLY